MEKFKITNEMRKWCEENKEDIERKYLDTMRSIWIDFCEEFNTEGNFDMWWNPDWDMYLMYVASVGNLPTLILDWDIWRETVDEFLDFIEDNEIYAQQLREKLKDFKL